MPGSPPGGHPEGPPPGPPYPPETAVLGGSPSSTLDVPLTAVFMVLFIIGAACNLAIAISNGRRGHKFMMSNMFFGFCMARTLTCIMRIVWTYRLMNVSVGIAAQIFVAAGKLLRKMIRILC